MTNSRLCDTLLDLCAKVRPALEDDPAAAETVDAVIARLEERTLRIAVGGRLNAGKSTLVNAMLGQSLASTDATECTRAVTWFRYHHRNQVRVTPRSGEPYVLPPAAGGGAPSELGRPVEEIASVTVEVSNTVLKRHHTVVDTPGLDSLTGGGALDRDSMEALADCDALLFVMPHPGQREQEALEALRAAMSGSNLALANTVGVLSRIDQLGDGYGDPWPQAERIAARYGRRLRALLADVIPVAGLLAATALGDAFTEGDALTLERLAGLAGPAERERLLYSPEEFLAHAPIEEAERRRLLDLLGLYGIGESLALADRGVRGAVRLMAEYRRLSGIDRLLEFVRDRFLADADPLRARSAVTALDRIAWSGASPEASWALAELRAGLDRLRNAPALRRGELAEVLGLVDAGRLRLPEQAVRDLVGLVTGRGDAGKAGLPAGAPPEEVAAAADERIRRWRVLEGDYRPAVARAARDVREAFEAIYYAAVSR